MELMKPPPTKEALVEMVESLRRRSQHEGAYTDLLLSAARELERFANLDSLGWLIEAAWQDHEGPYYLCARDLGGWEFTWKPDNDKALRFVRKEDAERCRDAVRARWPELFPVVVPFPQAIEHAWASRTPISGLTQ